MEEVFLDIGNFNCYEAELEFFKEEEEEPLQWIPKGHNPEGGWVLSWMYFFIYF